MDTVVRVKVDKATKEAALKVAESMGLNLTSLVRSYLRQVAAIGGTTLFAAEPMTPRLEKLIAKVEADGKKYGLGPSYSTAEALIASLNE